ncbi:sensor histidine kinase [Nocardia sp. NPDC055321]
MPPLQKSIGYLFLILFTLSFAVGGADALALGGCAFQAGLLVLAVRRAATRQWVLLAQITLTYLPIPLVGGSASYQGSLLAVTVLWCVPTRWRWVLFVLIVAGAGFARESWRGDSHAFVYGVLTTGAIAIVMYSLLRLPALVDRLTATRAELARVTLARERLEVAGRLRAALGGRLTAVMTLLNEAGRELDSEPGRARAAVLEAARATRAMTETVRATAALHRDVTVLPRDHEPVARLLPRLTLLTLAVSLASWTVNQVLESGQHRAFIAIGGAVMSTLVLAQLYWPRRAAPLLAVQAAITLLPLPWLGGSWCVWLILLAASVLLSRRGPWAWAAVAGLFALRAAYTEPAERLGMRAGWVILAMEATLVLVGLARFWRLSTDIDRSRAELVRITLQVERLRVARDIHDLLGLTLSVLALKSDLIAELITRDPRRAAAEIEEALRIAAEARGEARRMADSRRALGQELRSAALAVGVDGARVRLEQDEALPESAGAVLAPVVREAVTNILRHSAAARVRIECRVRGDRLVLTVCNDGVGTGGVGVGQGLRNMRARVTEAGGEFTTAVVAGEFRLTAAVPVPGYADCTVPAVRSHTGQVRAALPAASAPEQD